MKHNPYLYLLMILLSFGSIATCFAQRQKIALNKDWSFHMGDDVKAANPSSVAKVNIPHTWNAADVMDDTPGYYRGTAWYKKKLVLQQNWKNKQVFLYFEGVNQEATIYLNGKQVFAHAGGYTAFRVPLNGLKFNGSDEIWVKVSNAYNEAIAPLTADFTFFGGIYRNVSLLILDQAHFEDQTYGSNGVYTHAEDVSPSGAVVIVDGKLKSNYSDNRSLRLVSVLNDATGKLVGEVSDLVNVSPSQTVEFVQSAIVIKNPKLWSPENPYCYQVVTQLIDVNSGRVLDEIRNTLGLRFFKFDAKTGFFLNGKPYKLIGSSRHQDYAKLGNAVPSSLQIKDVELIKEMGGNFLRVAHYPQDQSVLDACDRLGILASVEIPIVNEITESESFYNNCYQMQLEMIKQNYNHPSIIIWAYMNEVLLRMKFNNDARRKQVYLSNIEKLAQKLEDLTRKADPTRYTLMSNHGDVNGYMKAGLTKIPMLVGWNLYQGWYGGKIDDFGPALDRIFQQIPDKPLLVTEFGADVDPRMHAFNPIRFDKSLEYGMAYHQVYIKEIMKRPFVAGAAVWNLADFNSETREESMPHVNNKGLLTLDRQPKNTYYLYKANFSPKPYLKIGNGSWPLRGGTADEGKSTASQPIQVVSNADSVSLTFNKQFFGTKKMVEKLATWDVPFKNGVNEVVATAKVGSQVLTDKVSLNFQLQPDQLDNPNLPIRAINVIMGTSRQFLSNNQTLWLPDKPYQKGSWGSIGGEAFKMKNASRQSYGTDKDILGTLDDPIYQTQLVGLLGYQLDVPNGKYEMILHFAELLGNGATALPYNLDSLVASGKEIPPQRIFDVELNGKQIIKGLNLAATHGLAKAYQHQVTCAISDNKGIRLVFKASEGQAVLNAIQVRKIE